MPRSPSYFGISYSRIRWSRNVFHVSSHASRWSWWRSWRVVREDEVWLEPLQLLEDVLDAAPSYGRKPSRNSWSRTSDDRRREESGCTGARLVGALAGAPSTTHVTSRSGLRARKREHVPPHRSRCRRHGSRRRDATDPLSRRSRRLRCTMVNALGGRAVPRRVAALDERVEVLLVLDRVHRLPEPVVPICEQSPGPPRVERLRP